MLIGSGGALVELYADQNSAVPAGRLRPGLDHSPPYFDSMIACLVAPENSTGIIFNTKLDIEPEIYYQKTQVYESARFSEPGLFSPNPALEICPTSARINLVCEM